MGGSTLPARRIPRIEHVHRLWRVGADSRPRTTTFSRRFRRKRRETPQLIRESFNSCCIYLPFTDITRIGTIHDTTDILQAVQQGEEPSRSHGRSRDHKYPYPRRNSKCQYQGHHHVPRTAYHAESPDSSSHTFKERLKDTLPQTRHLPQETREGTVLRARASSSRAYQEQQPEHHAF